MVKSNVVSPQQCPTMLAEGIVSSSVCLGLRVAGKAELVGAGY